MITKDDVNVFLTSSTLHSNVCALYIRVVAELILCFMSWCELKARYLSVYLGFLNTSILRSLYYTLSCYKCI